MPLVNESVCLKNMSDKPTVQLSGVTKTFSLHVSCKESLKLGEQNWKCILHILLCFFYQDSTFFLESIQKHSYVQE